MIAAAQQGPHILALASDENAMTHAEVEDKVKEGFVEVIYLDMIEHLLGADKWANLTRYPIIPAMEWKESPPFFCSSIEIAWDVADVLKQNMLGPCLRVLTTTTRI